MNTTTPTPVIRIDTLGPLECRVDGVPIALGGAKQQSVLALLALEAGSVVSVDRLLEWVWPDDTASGSTGTLQVYVSNLRRLFTPASDRLGRALIATQRPGYALAVETAESDLLEFRSLRAQADAAASAGRQGEAATHLRAALGCWRGPVIDGLPHAPGEAPLLAHIESLKVATMEQLAEAELAVGRHRELVTELSSWVSDHPLDERLRGHLMLALYRSGRQADALATYNQGRELLLEDLGLDPSRELRSLESRIIAQDPSLDLSLQRREVRPAAPSTQVRSSVVMPAAVLESSGQVIDLGRPLLTVGRSADRDVIVDDLGVSRVHAEIRQIGSSYVLVDVGSANGTVVNGRRVVEHVLAEGDVVRLGDTEFIYRTLT